MRKSPDMPENSETNKNPFNYPKATYKTFSKNDRFRVNAVSEAPETRKAAQVLKAGWG
jgi:hypothetical protein